MEKSKNKYIDLDRVYKILTDYSIDERNSPEDRNEIKRFVQKLSESSSFLNVVNAAFSSNERKVFSDNFKKALTGSLEIGEFIIRYNNKKKWWDLYKYSYDAEGKHEELFLDKLDWSLTKNIIIDINSAFLIKANRHEKNK